MREIKFRIWSEKEKAYLDGPGRFLWVSHDDTTSGLYSPTDLQITLEQYTGLKDKNGKEIYEGDIVEFGFSGRAERGYVAYADEYASFEVYSKRDFIFGCLFGHAGKVIGNIHENPELVGGK